MASASENSTANGTVNGTLLGAVPAHDWWEPQSFEVALVLALVSTACWGSWSNTAKAAADRVNFAHYYTDFCLGTILVALVSFVGPGHLHLGGPAVDLSKIGFAVAAGSVFGVANMLLTTGIAVAGLSIAFPLCIGTGLVLGTLLTYLVDRRGQPALIFPGVFLALLGVVANARAYGLLQRQRGQDAGRKASNPDEASTSEAEESAYISESSTSASDSDAAPGAAASGAATQNIVLCVVGGVLMGCWSPLSAHSMKGEEGLSPYWSFVCFTLASFAVGLTILAGQQCGLSVMPRVGAVTSFGEYFTISPALHGWGLLGGAIWALGTASNLVSGGSLGYALSYALGQTAPIVAVLWGLGWYREFDGAPRQAVMFLVFMFVLFLAAITLLCLGGR